MMTKERLRDYRRLKFELQQVKHQLEEMETRMYSAKGQIVTDMPHAPSGNGRSMEDMVAVHIRLKEKYLDKLKKIEAEQYDVECAIDSLPLVERQVLRARYIDGLNWEQVCDAVYFGWTQTHKIHSRALRMLKEEK